MGNYTDYFEDITYEIYEADDYLSVFREAMHSVRNFGDGLDTILIKRGYIEGNESVENKINVIKGLFDAAEIKVPRNIDRWYKNPMAVERVTALRLCFVLGLDYEESNDFLRRICLFRGLNMHSPEEIIYYQGLKNRISYEEARKLVNQVEIIIKYNATLGQQVFTNVIVNDVREIDSWQELVEYFKKNAEYFAYNNVTATKLVSELWQEIAGDEGLALKEKKRLYEAFCGDVVATDRKIRKRADDSRWEIYLQILGLAGDNAATFYGSRSIKALIDDNELIHSIAQDCFPDRDGINKIINGQRVADERIRKLLIALIFYRYWVKLALAKGNYTAESSDGFRCVASVNDYLNNAGFPSLYPGNPYDFIILYANNSDMPLVTFREYMRELYYNKRQELEVNSYE